MTTVDPSANIPQLVSAWASETPDAVAYRRKDGRGGWEDISISRFHQEVVALAKGLIAAGVQSGDRVGLMARTRYEWTLIDLAILFAGGLTVPVYETSSAHQVEWILQDSGAVGIFIESEQLRDAVHPALPVDRQWVIDNDAIATLAAAGEDIPDAEVTGRAGQANLASPATIIYTSGTTGRPKGCVLTHGNFVELCANTVERLREIIAVPGKSTLLFLPLAHVFARFIQMLALSARTPLGHTPGVADVVEDMASFRPTFVLSVPRVFEKIHTSAQQRAEASGRGRIFTAAAQTAIDHSRARAAGRVPLGLRARHALFDRIVYRRLREVLGGQLEYAVSGGGPLSDRMGHFFRGAGINILEGYGLTESTAPTCVNMPEDIRVGTVGVQLPGNSVRVDEDGEILLKGPHIFSHYHNNEDATRETFRDGWFATGDLGSLDDDGYLTITGRKKELIVTAGGKNVAPASLQDAVRENALVSQCLVVGDGRPYIAALITLDAEVLPGWLSHRGLPEMTPEQAREDEQVMAEIQRAVDHANETVSRAEGIKRFVVMPQDFTESSGHLTPSIKLRRAEILRDFEDVVEELYSKPR